MKVRINLLKIIFPVFLFSFSYSHAQNTNATTEDNNGLTTVTFETKNGNVTVHLPTNIHAGDVISGTVIAEPKGKNEKQLKKNKKVLNGYVYELEETKTPVSQDKQKWELPETLNEITWLILKDDKGNILGSTEIPVNNIPRPVITPGAKKISDFDIPSYIRAGELEKILGWYDGDFSTSAINIDDKPIEILAESPEGLFFEAPQDITGPVDLELTEGDFTMEGQTNVLDLELSADKLSLLKGEQTKVHISVSGMEELNKEVPIEITNLTLNNIEIKGGNNQEIIIDPASVNENGAFQYDLIVTAISQGGFSVMAGFLPPLADFVIKEYQTESIQFNPYIEEKILSLLKEVQEDLDNILTELLSVINPDYEKIKDLLKKAEEAVKSGNRNLCKQSISDAMKKISDLKGSEDNSYKKLNEALKLSD